MLSNLSRSPLVRRSGVTVAVGITVLAVVTMPAATAAPTWLPAETVSAPGESAFAPRIAVNGPGRAIAVWRAGGSIRTADRPAGGPWATPHNVAETDGFSSYSEPDVALDADGDATAVWHLSQEVQLRDEVGYVQAATRSAGGTWTNPVTISNANAGTPRLAGNSRGDAAAVWTALWTSDVYAASRKADGSWSAQRTLSTKGSQPQVVIDRFGNAAAVWIHPDSANHPRVQVARAAAGGSWSSPVTLSGTGTNAFAPQLAVDAQGSVIVVWGQRTSTTQRVLAARRPAGGSWTSASTISGSDTRLDHPAIALDARGNAMAGWTRLGGTVSAVRLPAPSRRIVDDARHPLRPRGGRPHAADRLRPRR